MTLKNKTTLITGASAGIGLACAESFAEAGSNLILFAQRIDRLTEMSENLKNKYSIEVLPVQCDVTNLDEVNKAFDLPESWKTIDILINNAGKAMGFGKIQDGKISDWEEMIDTNIKGLLYVSKAVMPQMIERKSGHIINIGSIAGLEVYPGGNVYCATKHAVKALSIAMAMDLNGTNIKITNIDPGLVETEFSLVRFHGDNEKAKKVYTGYEPLMGNDIADAALFAATRPAHVMIQNIHITPTAQATIGIVDKQK